MDKLQRRIQLDGIAAAFGATAVLTFAYGFLENAGFPSISMLWVMPLMIAIWGVSTAVSSWRYR